MIAILASAGIALPVGSAISSGTARPAGAPLRHRLTLTPDRASLANRLVLRLAAAGRPLRGAEVTVSFSMPDMHMFDAFRLTLRSRAPGVYTATMPMVGMAGAWRLDVRVHGPAAAAAFSVAEKLRN